MCAVCRRKVWRNGGEILEYRGNVFHGPCWYRYGESTVWRRDGAGDLLDALQGLVEAVAS